MNREQLEEALKLASIPPASYNLYGVSEGECLCLIKQDDDWEVLYNSRGKNIKMGEFASEEAACKFIYDEMKVQYKL